mgnify:CR=1 FL=1
MKNIFENCFENIFLKTIFEQNIFLKNCIFLKIFHIFPLNYYLNNITKHHHNPDSHTWSLLKLYNDFQVFLSLHIFYHIPLIEDNFLI